MNGSPPPRVLMFCGQFWPRIGGAERQALRLSKSLKRRGCHVEILTPQLEKDWPLRDSIDGIRLHRFPLIDLTRKLKGIRGLGLFNTILMGAQVQRAVRSHIPEFDILHAHIAWPMVAYAARAVQSAQKQTVCKIAAGGTAFDFISLKKTSPLGPLLAQKLLERVDRWVAISSEINLDLQREGIACERIVCIPNGVDIPGGDLGMPRALARCFLYLGRLAQTAHKDYETLLYAFDRLVAEFPYCQLKLVGGGEREGELRKILESLPHAKQATEVVGFSEPGPWFEWADALVHPSFAEGMSNTLLEGMAHGVACIANDILPNREVLAGGRAGILVPIRDVDALVKAMRVLVTVPGACQQWRQRGLKRARDVYSMDQISDSYLQLYGQLLKV